MHIRLGWPHTPEPSAGMWGPLTSVSDPEFARGCQAAKTGDLNGIRRFIDRCGGGYTNRTAPLLWAAQDGQAAAAALLASAELVHWAARCSQVCHARATAYGVLADEANGGPDVERGASQPPPHLQPKRRPRTETQNQQPQSAVRPPGAGPDAAQLSESQQPIRVPARRAARW